MSAEQSPGFRWPAVDSRGRRSDLFVATDAADPFVGPCPPWCERLEKGHTMEGSDPDRSHFGPVHAVPVRSIPGEYETPDDAEPGYVMGRAEIYLRRLELSKEAVVWLGRNDSDVGFELSLTEAEQIAELLQGLVRTAERGA